MSRKLAVIFPGVGYTCARPLLYYTASAAADSGYEVVPLDYGEDIHSFKGRTPQALKPVTEQALARVLPKLAAINVSEYEDIVFISKSIGTVISCRVQELFREKWAEEGLLPRQFLMTPLPDTLPYLEKIEGLFFAGTADPYIDPALVIRADRCFHRKCGGIFLDCDHSLEKPGDTLGNLSNVRKVVGALIRMLQETPPKQPKP